MCRGERERWCVRQDEGRVTVCVEMILLSSAWNVTCTQPKCLILLCHEEFTTHSARHWKVVLYGCDVIEGWRPEVRDKHTTLSAIVQEKNTELSNVLLQYLLVIHDSRSDLGGLVAWSTFHPKNPLMKRLARDSVVRQFNVDTLSLLEERQEQF